MENESSDSSCEQWQLTGGKQPCSGRRVKNGCRGRRERDESRSSSEPKTRRRIATKISSEESKSDERTEAVTTQESSDWTREKAMRTASIDELETGSSTARWSSPGRAESDRTGKVNELVRSLVGIMKNEGDIIVASGSKSKLWKDMSLKRAIQVWNMKCVDIARSPGSAIRVFISCERLASQLKINEIREVGKIGEEERDG